MRIVNTVRNLNDLFILKGLKSDNGKYTLLVETIDVGCEHISIDVSTDWLGELTIVKDRSRQYFTNPTIKSIVDTLSDLSFNVQYQDDSAENIIDDLCEMVDCMVDEDIKEYVDGLKKIIERIENLK